MTPVAAAPATNSEDTEITLGTGKMLSLFFGLVILCATFFGMGYSLGKSSAKPTTELLPSPSTSRGARTAQPVGRVDTPPAPAPDAPAKPAEQGSAPDNNSAAATSQSPNSDGSAAGQPGAPTIIQPGAGYFVQVAAVSKQEDAQALVDSLKARQYEAFVADSSPDKLFHVQVGPFGDVKDAEAMRTRLVNDGYNPILKK